MPAFRLLALTGLVTAPIAIGLVFAWPVAGASDVLAVGAQLGDAGSAREAYARARRAAADAELRAKRLDREATEAREAADRSAREAAALAARIQQAEADILAAQARLALITDQRRVLDARLAEQQQPLVQLTAALQNMARRPLVLSALQPGTLKDTVYVRAVLETTMPEIRDRTVGLRSELARGRELEQEAGETLASLRMDEGLLLERRRALEALATQQRLASREVRQVAQRESERALALSENARDLNSLVGELGRAGALRSELAALPGPLVRPPRPGASQVIDAKR
ncbi:MAG TPA: metalloendopeptidase, partial [Erythrobacter sp.]|nr:metalloendopeptidase [Erythrobacter sp.]